MEIKRDRKVHIHFLQLINEDVAVMPPDIFEWTDIVETKSCAAVQDLQIVHMRSEPEYGPCFVPHSCRHKGGW